MIVDTTVSFQEKRVCMVQRLHLAVLRKRAKKQKREHKTARIRFEEEDGMKRFSLIKAQLEESVIDSTDSTPRFKNGNVRVHKEKFDRLLDSIKLFNLYLKKARSNSCNQSVVKVSTR